MVILVHPEGSAKVIGDGLRCKGPRVGNEKLSCNKLLAKLNRSGRIAGAFKCSRCGQETEADFRDR